MVYPIINGMGPLPTKVEDIYKAEMHVHIQAILYEQQMREMAELRGLNFDALATGYHIQRWFGLKPFHMEYESLFGKLMKDPIDYYLGVYEYLKRCADENTMIVELSGSLRPPTPGKISNHDMLYAVNQAFQDAEKDFGIKAGFIANIVRDFGPDHAMWVTRQALELREKYPSIIGLGMSGDENCHDQAGKELELYVPPYELAHTEGLGTTVHAGETGFETFEKTLRIMAHCLDRVGHGIHALKAKDINTLKEYIRRHPKHRELYLGERKNPEREPRCVLEFCPSSYARLQSWNGEIKDLIHGLWDNGYRLVVGSDDPGPFKTSIGLEYKTLHVQYGIELWQLAAMTTAAIKFSFLPKDQIKMLYMRASRQKHLLHHQADATAAARMPTALLGPAAPTPAI